MSLFLPVRRATLLVPSGPAHDPDRKHLFILITDPVSIPESTEKHILMVSTSTVKTGMPHDPTCLIYPGDHPFIKHDSFISYRTARIEEAQKLLKGVSSGLLIPQGTIEGGIVARICKGLTESRQTAPKILRFFEIYNSL